MATVADKTPRIINIAQKPITSGTHSHSLIATHIQETKKLIKRNGETVEVVTLTLTGNSDQLQVQPPSHPKIVAAPSLGEKLQLISSSKPSTNVIADNPRLVTGINQSFGVKTVSTLAGGDGGKVQGEESANSSSSTEFLIVTSTPSGYTTEDADGKLTFLSTNSAGEPIETTSTHIDGGTQSQALPMVQVVGDDTHTADIVIQTPRHSISPSPRLTNDYSNCLICGDKGSGFHYSVFSCEGCKGFFKRSVQKNLTYTCKNDGNCDINRYSRNSCQYCRFRKCLQFGMKKEGVRDDRTPGGLTRARFKRMRTSDFDGPCTESEQSQHQLETDIQILVNCDPYISPSFVTTEEKTATLYGAFQLTAILYDDMIYTVKWAKQVLGFRTLELDDQKKLLQSCIVELSMFRLAYRSFASVDGRLRFAHDIELTLAESQQLGFDPEYIDAVLQLIERLKFLEIDDKEYAILCAIILFSEDAPGLRDTITTIKLQQKNLMVLQRYILLVYGGDMKRFGRILLRLPGLRTISHTIREVFEQFIVMDRPSIEDLIVSALLGGQDTPNNEQQVIITSVSSDADDAALTEDDAQIEETVIESHDTAIDPADSVLEATPANSQQPEQIVI